MTLTEKSRITLEWPRVLERLSQMAVSGEAKERCLALVPTARLSEALEWQAQTSAARYMLERQGSPAFGGLRPVAPALTRTQMGGILNTRELLDIASVLHTARALKRYASDTGQHGNLSGFFRLITGNKELEEEISGAILSETDIADNASPELYNIRRHIRNTTARVRELLQRYITSAATAKYLQDNIITRRSGRYVIPVKAEHKGSIPGLVHDVSASGATLFIEPTPVVDAGNQLREWEGKEQQEIDRILARLSLLCDQSREDILLDYDTLCALDVIFAKAKLSCQMNGTAPDLNDQGRIDFHKARHPLLPEKSAVPVSIRLGGDFDTLVVTGPNTGGKTVTLKTLGLLTLMAAAGLHIPASDGSAAAVMEAVYADIGDEQSIAQSLSTFSSHMTNIVGILSHARTGSLVLFDELGAGTDPTEGAALAVAIIEAIRRQGGLLAATTHYAELKLYALTTPGVENACCEFDVETLRPTYRLLIGIPGKSNAFAISRRLGLPEHIIEAAGGQVNRQDKDFEAVLVQLEGERQRLEQARRDAEAHRQQTEESQTKAEDYRRRIEKEYEKAAERARTEARQLLEEARRNADEIMREALRLKAQGMDNQQAAELRGKIKAAESRLYTPADTPKPEEPKLTGPVQPGDLVLLASTGTPATVLEPPDKNGLVVVQAGILKVTVAQEDLRPPHPAKTKKKKPSEGVSIARQAEPCKMELDLRGQMTEEGVMLMEQFIDNAVMNKTPNLTIIHGKGTGALRTAVQQALRRNKAVKSFRPGRYGEGEAGVTVVELK